MKFYTLFIIFLTISTTVGIQKRSELSQALDEIVPLGYAVIDIWNFVVDIFGLNIPKLHTPKSEEVLVQNVKQINERVSALNEDVASIGLNITRTILETFPEVVQLELLFRDLSNILTHINGAYEDLQYYLSHRITESQVSNETQGSYINETNVMLNRDTLILIERQTLERFALWATGPEFDSIPMLLKRLKKLIVTDTATDRSGIFELVKSSTQEIVGANVCNLKQSPYQVIFHLYYYVALAELKGNIILQFSYMLLRLYKKGDFTMESKLAQTNFEKNFRLEKEIVVAVLNEADRSMYKCDPKQYIEGINYIKLTKLLQGYIENEVNLNPYGSCSENCNYYVYTDYNGCYKQQFCAHQPECQGKVLECRFVDSDMNICVSSNSERRYDWIEYENGQVLGSKGICEYKNFFQVDSWWRYLFWHCSYCLCLCDDSRNSDRYFNLRDVVSDIEKNKVVTGVKLVKHNHIIHIQIQQGILGPYGRVNKNTISWKPVDDYRIDDHNVENNVDYHMMTWLERSLDLDEINGPNEQVVTGARFRKLGTHLNLEIRLTAVNFTTGRLQKPEYSYWKGNDNTDASSTNPRTEVKLEDPDIPVRKEFHKVDSKNDQFIEFQATSFAKDAAQNTVPFIDSQPLTTGGYPISGMGLIHRGRKGSGGFVAPKLMSYNFIPHL